ncbi:hypothetical protein PM3016_7233 [Paenibacillus mucilaginosus 3016]|uniref:DUF5666 domain-containing protein n=1 Tax=Paenibacillus mucilaginosus 3016 TaxID=1116391 RepID=H6NBP0_9BACL|nr:hypothetical protein [Paenibacillus mucilaginosus]AFC33809.1 hypothetical protein PM3016_7233 [Paenibacillus mucilaginosus 3016]WFA22198.1 hypothetical protein ERY13_36015 [Paenibacillus mucilaginosus]
MAAYKKTIGIVLGALLLTGTAYGAVSVGNTEVSAEVSKEVRGTFAGLSGSTLKLDSGSGVNSYTLAANAWVYRNSQKSEVEDLQAGDALEVILNSKNQAAYIKATAQVPAAAVETQTPSTAEQTAAAPAVETQAAASTETAAAEAVTADTTAAAATAAAVAVSGWSWDKLELELKSGGLKLKVKHEPGDSDDDGSDILIQTKDKAVVHLTGVEAEKLLSLLLQGLPTDRAAWEEALKQRLSGQFQIDASQLSEWELEVEWKENGQGVTPVLPPQNPKAQGRHDNGIGQEKQAAKLQMSVQEPQAVQEVKAEKSQGNAYGKDKEKDSEKNKEKNKGKGKDDEKEGKDD